MFSISKKKPEERKRPVFRAHDRFADALRSLEGRVEMAERELPLQRLLKAENLSASHFPDCFCELYLVGARELFYDDNCVKIVREIKLLPNTAVRIFSTDFNEPIINREFGENRRLLNIFSEEEVSIIDGSIIRSQNYYLHAITEEQKIVYAAIAKFEKGKIADRIKKAEMTERLPELQIIEALLLEARSYFLPDSLLPNYALVQSFDEEFLKKKAVEARHLYKSIDVVLVTQERVVRYDACRLSRGEMRRYSEEHLFRTPKKVIEDAKEIARKNPCVYVIAATK